MNALLEWKEDPNIPDGVDNVVENIKNRARYGNAFCILMDYQIYKYLRGKINADMEIVACKGYDNVVVCVSKPKEKI